MVKMKVIEYQRDSTGKYLFAVESNQQETQFLISLALDTLVRVGKLTLDDLSNENEIDLSSIPMEEFYSA
jgi:hypothetical protein